MLREFVRLAAGSVARPLGQTILLAVALSPALALGYGANYYLTNHTSVQEGAVSVLTPAIGLGGYLILIIVAVSAWSLWKDAKENVEGGDPNA